MPSVKQTQVTDINRSDFYKRMYPSQMDDISGLIDISKESDPIIAIDCCGWYYQEIFQKPIIMLETIKTALQFKLELNKFTKLIDNRSDTDIVWPKLNCITPTILMDRPPLLRYRTIDQLNDLLSQIARLYGASKILVRGNLLALDDYRLGDRFYTWKDLTVNGYVVSKFFYDTEKTIWQIHLKAQQ